MQMATNVKERPILFSGAMVRALLDGSKTQTRRVVKLPHNNPLGQWEPTIIGGENGGRTSAGETVPLQGGIWHTRTGDSLMCPHGQPGDRLWVRETWAEVPRALPHTDEDLPMRLDDRIIVYYADPHWDGARQFLCADGCVRWARPTRWTPSIHMPRWASRITLEVTGVRVERLQDISEADAMAEGIEALEGGGYRQYETGAGCYPAAASFRSLWRKINGEDSWDMDPWVWVVEFRRIAP